MIGGQLKWQKKMNFWQKYNFLRNVQFLYRVVSINNSFARKCNSYAKIQLRTQFIKKYDFIDYPAQSLDTDMQRLFYPTWPPSFSSHIKKEVSERPNAGNEISASEAFTVPRNAVTAGAVDSYESRNTKQKIPKFYQYIKIDACYGFTLLIQIVMPSFPHFLAISFDSDFHRAGSGNVDVMPRISTIAVLWCAQNLNTINP